MKRTAYLLAIGFLCISLTIFASLGSAYAAMLYFEDFQIGGDGNPGSHMYSLVDTTTPAGLVTASRYYAGLDWQQADPLSNDAAATDWQINIPDDPGGLDNGVAFAGADGDFDNWIKGFAHHPDRENQFNAAKIGSYNNPFYFKSMKLRTRAHGAEETDGWGDGFDGEGGDFIDGVDDRWLAAVTIQFNLGGGNQKRVTVDLSPDDWVEYSLADLVSIGFEGGNDLLATDQINAIKFLGEGARPINIENYDRFGLDDLWITEVPIPGAVWLLGAALLGLVGVRRKMKK